MTSSAPTPELPPVYCPVEPAVHPAVEAIERRAVAWVDRVGLYRDDRERRRVLGTNSAEFYARFAPFGPEHNVQMAAHWVYWGFAFDDARCDAGPLSARPDLFLAMAGPLQRALEVPDERMSEDPLVAALQDVGRSFRECAGPVQVRRFTEAHRAWLFAVAWQIVNRVRGHMPGLADYTAMRLHCSGGPPTLAMLEIATAAEVPAREMDSPAVRALTEMAILVAAWDNDLHSYRKETVEGHTDQNLVNVLMRDGGGTAEEAMLRAVGLRDRVMARFLRLRDEVRRTASQDLRRYLDCLGHAIRGNIDWALRTPRYNDAEVAGVPMAAPRWVDRPSDPATEPLPIPGIAWWWDPLAP
ncbi:terpene synthase family protein [Actinomadura fibrosa]|uniref:Terpene synthase n=1 Tax=Actinomadura fibrosa TaxID=111802 RepID=A0ABW2XZX2_9ACTN|nr:terpene synthase family protein [Actinomadura fibrosa]